MLPEASRRLLQTLEAFYRGLCTYVKQEVDAAVQKVQHCTELQFTRAEILKVIKSDSRYLYFAVLNCNEVYVDTKEIVRCGLHQSQNGGCR